MKRFEYKILDIPTTGWLGFKVDYTLLTQQLNEAGKHGWEVVSFYNPYMQNNSPKKSIIILKKEIQ
mgnify:CR=1 FL=1